MKIECPICGKDGLLQQRKNSKRIQHYQGFANGRRAYAYLEIGSKKSVFKF